MSDQVDALDDLLQTLKSELNDLHTRYYKREIPDVMTFTDLQKLVLDEAKAKLSALLVEARIDELKKMRFQQAGHDHVAGMPFSICPLCDRIKELEKQRESL